MSIVLSAIAHRGPLRKGNYREQRRYTKKDVEFLFGTRAGANINTTAALYSEFIPRYEYNSGTFNHQPSNDEIQYYYDTHGQFTPQGTLGPLIEFNVSSISLWGRLDADVSTTSRMLSLFTTQSDSANAVSLSGVFTINIQPSGAWYRVGKRAIITPNYDKGTYVYASIKSFTTAQVTMEAVSGNGVGGSQSQLEITQILGEGGMLSWYNMASSQSWPANHYGAWEIEAKLPYGKGHWFAWWWIRRFTWPPELDAIEMFNLTGSPASAFPHFGYIGSAGTLEYNSKRDGSGYISQFTPSGNYVSSFHVYGVVWDRDTVTFTIDGEPTCTMLYRWGPTASGSVAELGGFSGFSSFQSGKAAFPGMIFNYAIGPGDSHEPYDPTSFPQCAKIKRFTFWRQE